ncbi:hypothetical protein RQP46_002758 [Phenoliferia psychrophenolica]
MDMEANLASLDAQLNSSTTPLAQRFRALFTLKSIGSPRAIEIIGKGLELGGSALLGHELAYCLGQIDNPLALPILQRVLEDENEHLMAAEAMGAISDPSSLPILRPYLSHPERAIRETAEIAVAKIEWDNSPEGKASNVPNAFPTIDPAPAKTHSPLAAASAPSLDLTVPQLQAQLLDTKLSLFERYRAMFALRNDGGKEAVLALASGFQDDSALFRHEIAYVFGQLSSPYSVPSLIAVLRTSTEEDMVRHEAAEALGGIATDDCLPVLQEFAKDENCPRVVKESCEVALDMYEYERSTEFSYATPLSAAITA